MVEKIARSATFKLGLVTAGCIALIVLITTQVIHVRAELAVMGPILLFLGYLVSRGWTPLPEWNPILYWSVAIILTTLIEIVFASLY